jgi:hypothetical protein
MVLPKFIKYVSSVVATFYTEAICRCQGLGAQAWERRHPCLLVSHEMLIARKAGKDACAPRKQARMPALPGRIPIRRGHG